MKGSNTRIITKFGFEFRLVGERVFMVVFGDYGNPIYRQICEGGGFSGSTVTATEDNFRKVVARWRRQHRRGVNLEEVSLAHILSVSRSEMPTPATVDDDYKEQLRRAEKAQNAETTRLLNELKKSLA